MVDSLTINSTTIHYQLLHSGRAIHSPTIDYQLPLGRRPPGAGAGAAEHRAHAGVLRGLVEYRVGPRVRDPMGGEAPAGLAQLLGHARPSGFGAPAIVGQVGASAGNAALRRPDQVGQASMGQLGPRAKVNGLHYRALGFIAHPARNGGSRPRARGFSPDFHDYV